jgi:Zn-dependent metalloprotease
MLISISTTVFSAQGPNVRSTDSNNNYLRIDDARSTDPAEIISLVKAYYGLDASTQFVIERENTDNLGMTHYRYYQYQNDIKVDGAQLFIHITKEGEIRVNSRLVSGIEAAYQASLSESEALQKALDFIDADTYYWEIPAMEADLKEVQQDPNATYFPSGELLYSSRRLVQDGSDYELQWVFDIYAKGEKKRNYVYVNASTGAISFSRTGIHTDASEGVAHTRYHGVRNIIADSLGSGSYRLFDDTRGSDIHTRNVQESTDTDTWVEFTDSDNIWDNANAEKDEVAGDAHWSMEMTYDYFYNEHDLNGFNNGGAPMIAYVHYGENVFNAFWNGVSMNFGDGYVDPLISIDVVAHEFAHGVTSVAAGLIYESEYGALNESFSDIFGNAVEFYSVEDTLSSWKVGMNTFQLRNMADPNQYGDPDTYEGNNWVDPFDFDFDNGGVHINSGIQNYWFYLLSEGGSGVNDNGDYYEVEGLGIDSAAQIAFRNLAVYLGNTSEYIDAYELSVQSAADLYGECSEAVRQTIKAWYAVGIGVNELSKDVAVSSIDLPSSSCYLSEDESIDVVIRYQNVGCDEILESGSTISVSYRLNDELPVSQDIVLTSDLESGDTLFYTINNVDLSDFGKYYIDVWASIDEDLIFFNDTVYNQEVLHQVQLASEDIVGFESLSQSPDSFYVEIGENAEAKISTVADNTGTRGFKMTGVDVDAENIELPSDPEDNFDWNPTYNSKLCFCVDASDWDHVKLAFDMKQLFSLYWEELYGDNMSEYVSSMRLLVNNEQVGEQYHPTTETDDPYITYYVDLDDYAGEVFEACFETKAFIRNAEDPVPGSDGDNVYLDNVRFMDVQALSVNEVFEQNQFLVYPNPTNGSFTVELVDINSENNISVIDALGRVIYNSGTNAPGSDIHLIDISDFTQGIYIVKIQLDDQVFTKRIVLN